MKAADFLDKAARAAASARLLLNSGDVDGACNRAYYAMFSTARERRDAWLDSLLPPGE